MDWKKALFGITAVLLGIAIYMVFFFAPIPAEGPGEPESYRIFYFHVPIAITAYLAFTVVFISGIFYLKSKKNFWDMIALSAAEVGVVFALLTLATGSLWAKATWGEYWVTWDVRLNTSLALFLIYLAYLMVRKAVEDHEKRARLSAVFGIIGFLGVPLSFLSIRLWSQATLHPVVFGPEGGISGTSIIATLLINMVAFFLLCISLIVFRTERIEKKAYALE